MDIRLQQLFKGLLLGLGLIVPRLLHADVSADTMLAANAALDSYETSPIEVVAPGTPEETEAAPVANAAPAEEESKTLLQDLLKDYNINPSGSITLDYYNRYVWRGQYLDRDPVLQPGLTLSAAGFSVGYWSSWDMENVDMLSSDESDYFASYSYTYDIFTLTGGHTWYSFPTAQTSSKEYFGSIAVNTFLSPVISYYHDYEDGKDLGQGRGDYYSLALSRTLDVYKKYGINATLGGTVGYIDHQWINGTGWHFTPTAAINIPVTKSMIVSPTIGYNFTQGDLRDPAVANQERHGYGGVHTVVTF